MNPLTSLGFGPFFEEQLNRWNAPDCVPARIAAEHYGSYEVWAAQGSGPAKLSGALRHELAPEQLPGVGDWVALESAPGPDGVAVIRRIFDRRSVFVRGAAGRETRSQVVAANVDIVCVVCGLDADYNPKRIERYLSLIWSGGAYPEIILNKADLCVDAEERVREVADRCPGVNVHLMSALNSTGIEIVRSIVSEGITAALVGSSGAGKSTLVNAFLGEDRMATGDVSTRNGRGRHVTTHRQLVRIPDGGLLVDTPGMRELLVLDDEALETVFEDIAELSNRCRFVDCRHDSEPGCAVKAAVDAGILAPDRLENFRKIEKEAKAYKLRHDEHLRRQSERVWGQLHVEAERLRRWKRGE